MRNSRSKAGIFIVAALCVIAANTALVVAQEAKAVANSAATPADGGPVTDDSEARQSGTAVPKPSGSDDAVSAWLAETLTDSRTAAPQTLPRKQPPRPTSKRQAGLLPEPSGPRTLEMLWPLLLVLAVITGLAVLCRKYLVGGRRFGSGGVIEVLANHHLSSKQSLCLVRLGRKAVLVGVTPERISAVAQIDDPEEMARIISGAERRRPDSFTAAMARFSASEHADHPGDHAVDGETVVPAARLASAGSGLRELLDRIRNLAGSQPSAEPT